MSSKSIGVKFRALISSAIFFVNSIKDNCAIQRMTRGFPTKEV